MPDFYYQARRKNAKELLFVIFGGLAVVVVCMTLDPWLCVAGFHRVCLYRMFLADYSINLFSKPCRNVSSRPAMDYWTVGWVLRGLFLSLRRFPPTISNCDESSPKLALNPARTRLTLSQRIRFTS